MNLKYALLSRMPEIVGSHVWYSPLYLNLAITNRCNLSCSMCFRQFLKYEKREMSMDTFREIIRQIPKIQHINFCGIGEPFCHPNFLGMLELIRKETKASISFSTNATLLDDDRIRSLIQLKVDKLSVSIDGIGDSYTQIRHRNFDDVYNNVSGLKTIKDRLGSSLPSLELSFVCLNENVEVMPEMVALAKDLDAKSLYVLHPFCLSETAFQNHTHNRSKTNVESVLEKTETLCKEQKVQMRSRGLEPESTLCFEPWYQIVITEDGSIRPCCFIGNLYSEFTEHYLGTSFNVNPEDHTLGTINEGIVKVWKGEKYTNLRRRLLIMRKEEKKKLWNRDSYLSLRKDQDPTCDYCKICQFRFQTAC